MKKTHTLFFDGECNLCNFWVRFLSKKDKKRILEYKPLQREFPNQTSFNTVVLLEHQTSRRFEKSDAVLEALKVTESHSIVFWAYEKLPHVARNFIYDFVAKNRYFIFGRCSLK